ncbi:MAG: hypothetical protein R3C49_20865 [Planctomycetaceae bacterium]
MTHISRILQGLSCLACVCALVSGNVCGAEFRKLSLGFDSVGKVGCWLPIEAVVSGLPPGEQFQLRAVFSDPRGDSCVEHVATGTSDESGVLKLSGYFRPGRQEGFGSVQIVGPDSDRPVCRISVAHGGKLRLPDERPEVGNQLLLHVLDVPFLVTVGKVTGIDELLRNADNYSGEVPLLHGIRISDLGQLPRTSQGLDAIDLMLLVDGFDATEQQAAAIREWVMQGGNLFVSSGESVGELLKTPLGNWLNELFSVSPEPLSVRDLTPIQGFVARSTTLRPDRGSTVPMAVLSSDQTVRDVNSLDGTLLGTQSVGAGVVRFVAVELNRPPMATWNSLPQFYEKLMFGGEFSGQSRQESRSSRISQSGVSDLGTQLLATVNATPQTGRWSTWSVMAMIVAYLFLVGPLDYLLVTRVFGKPELTWLTFPLLVIAGVGGLISLAGAGRSERLNELHLVDVTQDPAGQQMTVHSWMSLSCPDTMRTALTAEPILNSVSADADVTPVRLGWSGRPEDVYGGMYRVGGIGLGRHLYHHDPVHDEQLSEVPLLANGSRELLATWHSRPAEPQINSSLTVSGYGLLNGSFTHQLPFTISDWVLMHGNRVYRSNGGAQDSVLTPGQEWSARNPDIFASDLKAFLNASRLVQSASNKLGTRGATQVITPYDRQSADPIYILSMSSFYQTAGGADYVGLSNALMGRVELSDTVRLNHAVLIGRADQAATGLSRDGQRIEPSESRTLVRLLIPVDRRPARGLAPTKEELEGARDASDESPGSTPAPPAEISGVGTPTEN